MDCNDFIRRLLNFVNSSQKKCCAPNVTLNIRARLLPGARSCVGQHTYRFRRSASVYHSYSKSYSRHGCVDGAVGGCGGHRLGSLSRRSARTRRRPCTDICCCPHSRQIASPTSRRATSDVRPLPPRRRILAGRSRTAPTPVCGKNAIRT